MNPPGSRTNDEPGGACERDEAPPGWARWVRRIVLPIAVIAMIVAIWSVGLTTILRHLATIGWWFALLFAIEGVITTFDAAAIHALACGPGGARYRHVLIAQIAGRAVNATTPSGTLGEATKASLLTETMSTDRAVAAVLYYSLAGAVIQLIVIALGAPLTAVFLDLAPALEIGLYVAGVVAAAIAIGLGLLVRRGMVSSIVDVGVKLRIVSARRRERWRRKLEKIDDRLHSTRNRAARRRAVAYVFVSKCLTWTAVWLTLYAAGYSASFGELAALFSAGIVLSWIANMVPLGLGVTESGNYALFAALGIPPAFGVALALARRILYLGYAAVGFALLSTWRVSSRAAARLRRRRHPHQGEPHVDTHEPRDPAAVGHAGGSGGAGG